MLNWYIFYTYPKSEKSIYKQFTKAGYEVYLPLQEVVRKWHDRLKKLQMPLFPNYIFVRIEKEKIYQIISHPRVISFVSFNGKASIIEAQEIERIRKIESSRQNFTVNAKLTRGQKIKIINGPLEGVEGILTHCTKNKKAITINIPSIQYSLSISIQQETMISMEGKNAYAPIS